MISNQERLYERAHTSPMKAGREGYIFGKWGWSERPFRPYELVPGYRPGYAGCKGFKEFAKNMAVQRRDFQFFELLTFLAAICFLEKSAFGFFELFAFRTAGGNDFGFAGFVLLAGNKLHRLAPHHQALMFSESKSRTAEQDKESHQDGDRSV
jgi:hypothetical protein